MGTSVHISRRVNRAAGGKEAAPPILRTWCQQDDGGDDQRADDQNDKEGDRYSLPVPLRRVAAHQLLQERGGGVRQEEGERTCGR